MGKQEIDARNCGLRGWSHLPGVGYPSERGLPMVPARYQGTDAGKHERTSFMSTQVAAASGTFKLGGDLEVNRLGYGTMQLTGKGVWGEPDDRDEAIAVLRRAVEQGVNFIDTADSYGPEVAEALIREALHPYPEDLVIATKAGLTRSGPGDWRPVGRPEYLRQQCELSLRRLGLETIDLFQLHRIDAKVPLEEQIGELANLQQEGKLRHIGLSEIGAEELEACLTSAALAGDAADPRHLLGRAPGPEPRRRRAGADRRAVRGAGAGGLMATMRAMQAGEVRR
jgi:hypothetical protein